IYSITEAGTFTLLFSFQPDQTLAPHLFNPTYSPMFASPDGKLYGIVDGGGAHGAGGVFQFDTHYAAAGITVIRDFDTLVNDVSNVDGAYAIGPFEVGADRHL